jgi:hypothetical protein
MAQKIIKYSFVTIGVYLGLYYGTNGGKLLSGGKDFTVGVVKAFQGR